MEQCSAIKLCRFNEFLKIVSPKHEKRYESRNPLILKFDKIEHCFPYLILSFLDTMNKKSISKLLKE